MSRINSNVPSMVAQRVLGQNNNNLNTSLNRLSTGLRINSAKDDPAGLIGSQNLRAEKAGLSSAIGNAERADQVVNIAEGGLDEISGMLTELQSLITTTANAAGLSQEEKEANQLQIDSILQTIDRVSSATSFQGAKLLNGNFDYEVTGVDAGVESFKVNGAKLEFNGSRDVDVLVTTSAQRAGLYLSTGGELNLGGATAVDGANSQFVIEIAGNLGSRELSFSSGTEVADIVATINTFTDVTGVSAHASGTGLRVDSTEFGVNEFVSVKVIDDGAINAADGILNLSAVDTAQVGPTTTAWSAATNGVKDTGQDVEATINGVKAVTSGTNVRINTDFLDVDIDLTATASRTLGKIDAFNITGGGADFQLAGKVDIAGKVALGIQNVATRDIGRASHNGSTYFLKDLSAGSDLNVVDGDINGAQKAVTQAIKDVSGLRGRLGAFQQNTIGATMRSLGVALENTTAAESVIRDADFAAETAALTRSQILSQSATSSLQQANQSPQAALSLLG